MTNDRKSPTPMKPITVNETNYVILVLLVLQLIITCGMIVLTVMELIK